MARSSSPAPGPVPVVRTFSEIPRSEVEWLLEPYLPLGKVVMLEGDPGTGKTFFALWLASRLSTGDMPAELTMGVQMNPIDVLFMTAEDGLDDTIGPRLDSLGADVNRVSAFEGKSDENGKLMPVSFKDVDVIEAAIKKKGAQLVIVDPIQAFIGAEVDVNQSNQTRPLMSGLMRVAASNHCTILVIRHLRKSKRDVAASLSGLGSVDITAAVRSQWTFGHEPGDTGRLIAAHSKSNLADPGESLAFRFDEEGALRFDGVSEVTADDLVSESSTPRRKQKKSEKAADYLREKLRAGPVPALEVIQGGKELGLSASTLRRTKNDLGVVVRKTGGRGAGWVWVLPGWREGQRCSIPPTGDSDHLCRETDLSSTKGGSGNGLEHLETPKTVSAEPVL